MLLAGTPAGAATAPTLGNVQSYAVLGATTVTNTGPTVINGDLGVSPGTAVTGFPPGIVTPPGTIHAADVQAVQAQTATTDAYNGLASDPCTGNLTGQDLGGLTLTPGTYCFDSSAQLTGTLTLDAQGNPASVFIFKTGSTLVTAPNSSVIFADGLATCSVFWQVGSSATLGTQTSFQGSILAMVSITATTGATLEGRLLARTGAVTLDTNRVTVPTCTTVPPAEDDTTPTDTTPPDTTPVVTPTPTPPTGTPVGPDSDLPAGTVVVPGNIVITEVAGNAGTSTATTSSVNPSHSGQSVTLSAVVTPTASGLVPTGRVTFIDGSTVLGTVSLDGRGRATFTTSSLTTGDHSITTVYQGGPGLNGSISRTLVQRVLPAGPAEAQLVRTGINPLPFAFSGSALILLGAAVLLEERRRAKKVKA